MDAWGLKGETIELFGDGERSLVQVRDAIAAKRVGRTLIGKTPYGVRVKTMEQERRQARA